MPAPRSLIENRTFDKITFSETPLEKGEYENCSFTGCMFSSANFSDFIFTNCTFTNCDLSLAKLTNTAIRECVFSGCKMMGLHFDSCNAFNFSFTAHDCILDQCSFYEVKLKKLVFKNTRFYEADFTGCDLSGAVLDNCDFMGARFENTNLEKADLRTAVNYSIDPELNRISKAKFSIHGLPGLLQKYDIEIE